MGLIGGTLGYRLLKSISKGDAPGTGAGDSAAGDSAAGESGAGDTADGDAADGDAGADQSKLVALRDTRFWEEIKDKTVIDFGCGAGAEAVEMAEHGARKVIGVDIQEKWLAVAREHARRAGVSDRCSFTTQPAERADVIVSIDAFEHFDEPPAILRVMREMLNERGFVIVAFGPTWYHPLGGHLFSVFPWAHLLFTEKALMRWRADFKTDGATRFGEVAGGLNQMTIRRFEQIVGESPFRFAEFEARPIRRLRPIANRWTRELTTSIVRCKLIPRD